MRLTSPESFVAKMRKERVSALKHKLKGMPRDDLIRHIKANFKSGVQITAQFTWSDESEVRERFEEMTLQDAFAFCLANEQYYNALLEISRSQFKKSIAPPHTPSQPKLQDSFPHEKVNTLLLKDFLSSKPGAKKTELTLTEIQIKETRVAQLMELYHEALPDMALGTSSKNHNQDTLVSLFSDAFNKSESTMRKVWENRKRVPRI